MTSLFPLILALAAAAQEPVDELKKELERLRQENQALQDRSIEDARTIQRLKQAIKALEGRAADLASVPAPLPAPPIAPAAGPVRSIKARITHVVPKENWIMISIGKRDGVAAGWRFDINRLTHENATDPPKVTRLGLAEFEKYIGPDEGMSKLKILEGTTSEMKLDDEAVAIRQLGAVSAETKKEPEASKPGVYKITGRAGADGSGFVVNYGTNQGARQTDLVFAYKDGKLKAKLRLDTVQTNFSIVHVVDGTETAKVEETDQIYTKEFEKSLAGKVVMVDDKKQLIAVDIRAREGARVGHRFEIRRQGQKVGVIILTEVNTWGSWAKPEGDTRFDQIQRGDFAEILKEG